MSVRSRSRRSSFELNYQRVPAEPATAITTSVIIMAAARRRAGWVNQRTLNCIGLPLCGPFNIATGPACPVPKAVIDRLELRISRPMTLPPEGGTFLPGKGYEPVG
jgi:hypothetical protein